jgi:hypothetical protein
MPIVSSFCALGMMMEWARRASNRATVQDSGTEVAGDSEQKKLAQLSFFSVIAKAFGMGLVLSADVQEIATNSNSSWLTGAIISFRLVHTLSVCFLLMVIFGPSSLRERMRNSGANFLQDATSWTEYFDYDFATLNFEKTAMVFFVCAYDISMVPFLPWKDTPYYQASKGYASEGVMLFIVRVDIVQKSLCAIIYFADFAASLDGHSNTLIGLVLGLLMSLSSAVLSSCLIYFKDFIKEMASNERRRDKESESSESDDDERKHPPENDSGMEFGALYPEKVAEGQVRDTTNPLHGTKEQNIQTV